MHDELVGGSLAWVRQIAFSVFYRRWDVSGETVEVSFAGRMMDNCPITRFRTAFVSRNAPDPTENTREKIPVEKDG